MPGGRANPGFNDQLATSWRASGSRICVGLDPDPSRFPAPFAGHATGGRHSGDAFYKFCAAIVDATAPHVCAFKPQIAYFAARGQEQALERLCTHIRENYPDHTLILDAKRGDIGSTAEQYAIEAFDRYSAHAVTVNPYLGTDAAAPFLERGGVFALCRTTNPGSGELQELDVDGVPLYLRVARMVATQWTQIGECGLVAGAVYPDDMRAIRDEVGTLPLLVPGIGAQGGSAADVVAAGKAADGHGLVISSSRAILYASSGDDFADAAAQAARRAATEAA